MKILRCRRLSEVLSLPLVGDTSVYIEAGYTIFLNTNNDNFLTLEDLMPQMRLR